MARPGKAQPTYLDDHTRLSDRVRWLEINRRTRFFNFMADESGHGHPIAEHLMRGGVNANHSFGSYASSLWDREQRVTDEALRGLFRIARERLGVLPWLGDYSPPVTHAPGVEFDYNVNNFFKGHTASNDGAGGLYVRGRGPTTQILCRASAGVERKVTYSIVEPGLLGVHAITVSTNANTPGQTSNELWQTEGGGGRENPFFSLALRESMFWPYIENNSVTLKGVRKGQQAGSSVAPTSAPYGDMIVPEDAWVAYESTHNRKFWRPRERGAIDQGFTGKYLIGIGHPDLVPAPVIETLVTEGKWRGLEPDPLWVRLREIRMKTPVHDYLPGNPAPALNTLTINPQNQAYVEANYALVLTGNVPGDVGNTDLHVLLNWYAENLTEIINEQKRPFFAFGADYLPPRNGVWTRTGRSDDTEYLTRYGMVFLRGLMRDEQTNILWGDTKFTLPVGARPVQTITTFGWAIDNTATLRLVNITITPAGQVQWTLPGASMPRWVRLDGIRFSAG